jgi:hypothetical protein
MDKKQNNQKDLLKQYINPAMSEKAPAGFTSRVMEGIRLEKVPARVQVKREGLNIVPTVSAIVIIILVFLAVLLPDKNDQFVLPAVESVRNLKFNLPDMALSTLFRINLPSTVIYSLIGISILSVFDRALKEIFHRDDQTTLQRK